MAGRVRVIGAVRDGRGDRPAWPRDRPGRSLRLSTANLARGVWIRLIGYLAWLLIRLGLSVAVIVIIRIFFDSPSNTMDNLLLGAAWLVVNALALRCSVASMSHCTWRPACGPKELDLALGQACGAASIRTAPGRAGERWPGEPALERDRGFLADHLRGGMRVAILCVLATLLISVAWYFWPSWPAVALRALGVGARDLRPQQRRPYASAPVQIRPRLRWRLAVALATSSAAQDPGRRLQLPNCPTTTSRICPPRT